MARRELINHSKKKAPFAIAAPLATMGKGAEQY